MIRPMNFSLRITPKLTLVFLGFGAAILVALSGRSFSSAQSSLHAATVAELYSTAIEKQGAFNAWVDDRLHVPVSLAEAPSFRARAAQLISGNLPDAERKTVRDLVMDGLRGFTGRDGNFLDMLIIDARDGKVIAAVNPAEEGRFKEYQPYFVNGKQSPYVQNLYYSIPLQAATMTAAVPIRAPEGNVVGVLAARLRVEELDEIISRRTGLRQTDDAFLVTTNNLFATQPRFVSDPAILRRGVYTEPVKRCLAPSSGFVAANDYRGEPVFAVYRWMPERNLCLIVNIEQAEALAPIRDFGGTLLLFSALVLLAAGLIAYFLARTITQPILALQVSAAKLSAGDLTARAPEAARDEVGALAREFNAMAAAIAEKEAGLKQRAEQLGSANKELEAFTYSVSHDLRAPLRAITGFARILLDDYAPRLEPATARYLHLIATNTQQMGKLVDDLLAFSRLGRQTLNKETIQPEKIVRRVLADLQSEQENRALDIRIGSLAPCQADAALLTQVWANLIANALKFTRTRENAVIEIGCMRSDKGQGAGDKVQEASDKEQVTSDLDAPLATRHPSHVTYFVRDNGVGFDMQYAHKLFGVFQRLHRADEFEGTGVGLAIVQRIVHRHGGRVWAESETEKGATFYFTLE
ncbi:MAG: HAMP domain-containing protein [Chloroflexi bacterium]|nr:HAMP domain-containing protein [Chloroflexota bacterium]